MTHPSEEELIAYRENDAAEHTAITEHLRGCSECRAEFARLNADLAAIFTALDALDVPPPRDGFAQHVWTELAPRLEPKRHGAQASAAPVSWWQTLFVPRHFAALAVVAALVIVAFFAGRLGTRQPAKSPEVATAVNMREKVMLLAVGEHLGRSEMMLMEIANGGGQRSGSQLVNISAEQRRAEDLLTENRLYRQAATELGDARIASVLDELERTLLDVAHSPDEVTGAQLQAIRERIEAGGILFKVRVVGEELQERQRPSPAGSDRSQGQGNKI